MDQKKPNPLCPVVVLSNVDMIAMMPELRFIDELYHVIENRLDLENAQDKEQFEKIKAKYRKISEEHGAQIKGLYYISRDEPFPDLYENADFSIDTIKASIRDGELKTKQILNDYYRNQRNVL